jgi:hypothetical protein
LKGTKTNGLKRMSIANFVMQGFVEPNMTFNNMKENCGNPDEKITTFRTSDSRCRKHSSHFKPGKRFKCFIQIIYPQNK